MKESAMRAHIGTHFVLGHFERVTAPCGYCGLPGCQPKLTKQERSRTLTTSCNNFYGVGFRLPKTGKPGCMNHVLRCPTCQDPVWAHNLKGHYADFHKDEPAGKITQAYEMTNVEYEVLMKESSKCKCLGRA